jgi:hypothetical protein
MMMVKFESKLLHLPRNLKKSFVKRWQTEMIDDVCVLPKSAVNEVEKLLKHVRLGCLSNIPAGIGTNRNVS